MIRTHLDAMDTNENLPMVELPSTPIVRNKSLRKNHACTLYRLYRHYSHHCHELPKFWMALADLHQHSLELEITLIEEVHPHLLLQTPCPFTWCRVLLTLLSPPRPMVNQTYFFHCFYDCRSIRNRNLSRNLNLSYQGNNGVHSWSTWSFSVSFPFLFPTI